MDRHVGFIDVGYLQAASASALSVKPRQLTPKPEACVEWLKELGPSIPGEPLFLRAYWYDGAYDPRHPKHDAQRRYFDRIANVPGIQLRLGHLQVNKSPKWQYPVKAALKKVGVDLAEFEKHYQFRPELGKRASTLELLSISCAWRNVMCTTWQFSLPAIGTSPSQCELHRTKVDGLYSPFQ